MKSKYVFMSNEHWKKCKRAFLGKYVNIILSSCVKQPYFGKRHSKQLHQKVFKKLGILDVLILIAICHIVKHSFRF